MLVGEAAVFPATLVFQWEPGQADSPGEHGPALLQHVRQARVPEAAAAEQAHRGRG